MFLTCTNFPLIGPLIGWIADLLGLIMNLLYNMFEKIGMANVGLCIIVFTFCVKMLMLPLTLKQQKFTKLSSVMSPELQAIQKKYKGKTDQDSMLMMQAETKAVYAKYGTSQAGGCVQLLIQFPIILALYAVISLIPNYVGDVKNIYINQKEKTGIVDVIYDDRSSIKDLNRVYKLYIEDYNNSQKEESKKDKDKYKIIDGYFSQEPKDEDTDKKNMYNLLVSVNTSEKALKDVKTVYEAAQGICDDLSGVRDDTWNTLLDKANDNDKTLISTYRSKDYDEIKSNLKGNYAKIEDKKAQIRRIYNFGGIDLSVSPQNGGLIALLIPLLSALTQFLSMKISSGTQSQGQDNPMASSMKVMSITMPLVSAFFCWSLPAGLGLYWVATSVVQIFQQLGINAYFKKIDVDDIIKANMEKAEKRMQKREIPSNTITNAAKTDTKRIEYNDLKGSNDSNTSKAADDKPKLNSISSKANMVKNYNEKNSGRKDK